MTQREAYGQMAIKIQAIENCKKENNIEWLSKHEDELYSLVSGYTPSGSGCDDGTHLIIEQSNPNRLTFQCDYHHMNENGYYDGWTEHKIIITPCLCPPGFEVRVTGRDRNGIKDYLAELFL